jgi:toxin ParE1/3/4
MQRDCKYSKKADLDLESLTLYSLESFGESQTNKYITGFKKTLQNLTDSPNIGKPFSYGSKKYRMYRYMSHTVYYRESTTGIFVVRILHSKMLPSKHL